MDITNRNSKVDSCSGAIIFTRQKPSRRESKMEALERRVQQLEQQYTELLETNKQLLELLKRSDTNATNSNN